MMYHRVGGCLYPACLFLLHGGCPCTSGTAVTVLLGSLLPPRCIPLCADYFRGSMCFLQLQVAAQQFQSSVCFLFFVCVHLLTRSSLIIDIETLLFLSQKCFLHGWRTAIEFASVVVEFRAHHRILHSCLSLLNKHYDFLIPYRDLL